MEDKTFEFIDNKIIIRIRQAICENTNELLHSDLFIKLLKSAIDELQKRNSYLLGIFGDKRINDDTLERLIQCLMALSEEDDGKKAEGIKKYGDFLKDRSLFNDFIEYFYNFWRGFDRFIICDDQGRNWDKRPYRTFNSTIGHLTGLIRGLYRDTQESVTGVHPRIYRQVSAGAEMATISVPQTVALSDERYKSLNKISMVRQVLLNPPLILNPPMNKRKGHFHRIEKNPLDIIKIEPADWLCYPAKVGPLLILVYIHKRFIDLGLSLCNLFQLADDEDLDKKPDAIYFYGTPGNDLDGLAEFPTVFYEDNKNNILVAAVPNKNEFGYFGYLKKNGLNPA